MKSVIITGASSGICKEASVRLARSGYRVFGLARSHNKLQALATELPVVSYIPVEFDITHPDNFGAIAHDIATKGDIFGLVNSAGYVEPGAIEDISMLNFRTQFETDFFGLIRFTKLVLPFMMKNGQGRIVNVSSMAGLVSPPLIGGLLRCKACP